jgi:hypothetical protein
MSFKMSSNFADSNRAVVADEDAGYEDFGLLARWGERAVTAAAVSLALLFVTTVALLMGLS